MRIILIVAALCGAAMLGGCTDPQTATRALDGAGYQNIEMTGYQFFGCGEEFYHTGFKAVGPTGRQIEGVVCSDMVWGKGATIRTY